MICCSITFRAARWRSQQLRLDTLNRLISSDLPATAFTYDNLGRMLSAAAAGGSTLSWAHDALMNCQLNFSEAQKSHRKAIAIPQRLLRAMSRRPASASGA